ncbi:hypothetical protein TNCV_4293831 [Trichonephila clavipes]|uniref:Uncharacterized protein n=1 Tax=Trichonephila clavipes TaxID=2585209 RepID=A0A8X6V4M4_TRICX|nr:hypothetical protein TNCV_4293831 [Trichonephila clavipes]
MPAVELGKKREQFVKAASDTRKSAVTIEGEVKLRCSGVGAKERENSVARDGDCPHQLPCRYGATTADVYRLWMQGKTDFYGSASPVANLPMLFTEPAYKGAWGSPSPTQAQASQSPLPPPTPEFEIDRPTTSARKSRRCE